MAAAGFRLALTAALLAGCTSVDVKKATLAGTKWRVTAINGHSTPGPDGYELVFTGDWFSGRMGCNQLDAAYSIAGERILPGMTVATQAACLVDDPTAIQPMTFEQWAFRTLRAPMRMRWHSGTRLVLVNAAGSINLERLP